jgi:hypothetical protein
LSVTGEPDNFDVGVGVQQHSICLTHDLVVIDHQYFDVLFCYRIRCHSGLLGIGNAINRS